MKNTRLKKIRTNLSPPLEGGGGWKNTQVSTPQPLPNQVRDRLPKGEMYFLKKTYKVSENLIGLMRCTHHKSTGFKPCAFVMSALLYALIFLFPHLIFAQNCTLTISGQITDEHTEEPISYANIFLEESLKGVVSDTLGRFELKDICPKHYHLSISHIGCETQRFYIDLQSDTMLFVVMDHHSHDIEDIIVIGDNAVPTTQQVQSITAQTITENADENLSNMLETITGVSTLRNGNGIAKPVVHGLYGNRLTILNNGVAQSGQQWGNDHSPEIDPLVANRLSVIKGVGAVEYAGSSLGAVILVEPKKIAKEPHLHGRGSYFFETNGFGHGINAQVQQHIDAFAWKLNGTFKRSGDKRSATYWLRNSGAQEANFALQLEKSFSEKWLADVYLSSFNTSLGVLRGAHIGNLTDLEQALERDVPFFTEENFTYTINNPRQAVNHHLLKAHTKYFLSESQWIDLTYAGQLNIRKEFDVRKGDRDSIPALSLTQLTNFFEAKYERELPRETHFKTGVQFQFIDNTNNPGTGILPLIPDYFSSKNGAFVMLNRQAGKLFLEAGARYDYVYQHVATISRTLPREIVRFDNHFHNVSAVLGANYELNESLHLAYNIGAATRHPAINELYSGGLHQGVSGIEEGDENLNSERSLKTTLTLEGSVKDRLFFEVLGYFQHIGDYIYLNPQDEIRLTIRGAFPVFRYEQTDAQLLGADLSAEYHILENFNAQLQYSYLRGQDISADIPLIFMPANNLRFNLDYDIAKIGKLENIELSLTNRYVFEQTRLEDAQDFAPPPPAYLLTGIHLSAQRQLANSRLTLYAKVDNLFNVRYRDYLNRQRYFADDLGIGAVVGGSWVF